MTRFPSPLGIIREWLHRQNRIQPEVVLAIEGGITIPVGSTLHVRTRYGYRIQFSGGTITDLGTISIETGTGPGVRQ